MKALFAIGLVILILGVASLFVPIPQKERAGIEVGGVGIGVESTTPGDRLPHRERRADPRRRRDDDRGQAQEQLGQAASGEAGRRRPL